MEDSQIIQLYWERSETAISETHQKYGPYCRRIAYNILHSSEDSEECLNDTYLRAWNAMPPKRPDLLSVFLGRITRNLSLDRFKSYQAQKRGEGQTVLALAELEECVPAPGSVEQVIEEEALAQCIDRFLKGLSREKRRVFLLRYWYLCPIREIASQTGMSENKLASMLFRIRKELRRYLEKEGVAL